jgi:hypothetical protein
MKSTHLTDTEIQAYVLQEAGCSPASIEHIRRCEKCMTKARAYILLFGGVAQQIKPDFEFDLSEVVMKQLVRPKSNPVRQTLVVSFICLLSATFLGAIVFVFGVQLLNLFSGQSTNILYCAMLLTLAMTCLLVVRDYHKFQQKVKELNFN